ncbi:MAG: glycogen/starch synthase, partial [Candidatus Omnitrophota bacterium]
MKIAMVASEVVPFAKTGGLADVAGALPMALEKIKHEVIIIMPKYKSINQPGNEAKIGKNIKVYFIENEKYFSRPGLYGEKTGDYPDNLERFSFFCKKALELMKKIKFQPDIIHCHDWQTSLVPVYLKTTLKNDPFFKKTRSVVTIHNIGYQGLFKKEEFPKLGLDWSLFGMNGLEFFDRINILKGGLVFSDVINTVSPTYSQEILDPKQGFGLEGILLEREERLFGILNGIDNDVWNPAEDKYLAKKFSAASLENKTACKEALQKDCKLAVKKDVPLFGFVGRLAEQKGFDLI